MITLTNGNVYLLQSIMLVASGRVIASYQITNSAAQALGFPASGIELDLSAMPELVPVFAEPMTTQLPTLQAMENWIVADHSSDGQTALQMFTSGVLS